LAACAHEPKRDPDASAKRLALGADYYAKHLVPAAIVELEKALELDPHNPEALYMMGVLKMGQGVEHLELAERATCLRGPARAIEQEDATKKLTEAADHFERAIQYRPGYAEAYDGLAVLAIERHDFEAAVRYEQRAQENAVFAENPIAKGNLGWAYYGKKDFVRAEKELREAVSKAPKFCVGHYRLAQVLYDQGGITQAAEVLGEIVGQHCPIQEAYKLLGLSSQRLHDEDAAVEAFDSCIRLAPKSCIAQECRKYASLLDREANPR